MAELRGLHASLAAFLHIIDTSRLLKLLKNDDRAILTAAARPAGRYRAPQQELFATHFGSGTSPA